MKKLITLLFCTVVFASAFAQSKSRDWDNRNSGQVYQDRDRDGDRDDHRYDNRTVYQRNGSYQNNTYSIQQRDAEVQRIAQQYDWRIQQVNYDRSLSRREKKNAIKQLQAEKIQRINAINAQFNNRTYNGRSSQNNGWYNR